MGQAQQAVQTEEEVNKLWEAYYTRTLKACVTPWYRVLLNTLFCLPEPSVADGEKPSGPPDADAAAFLQTCRITWYKSFFA